MPAVARARAHRGVKDDEVVAHYARADEASPGVIRIDQPVERVGSRAATTLHPTSAERPRRVRRGLDSRSAICGAPECGEA